MSETSTHLSDREQDPGKESSTHFPHDQVKAEGAQPRLGLVCLTRSDAVRYRTITRARYLQLSLSERQRTLHTLYSENIRRLQRALSFCVSHDILLYRVPSGLFPQHDDEVGVQVLETLKPELSGIGQQATLLQIRLVQHPDQYVVLNSDAPQVRRTSSSILQRHARLLDLLNLPRSPWAAITIHGGKAGRAEQLLSMISDLPETVRSRLTLENDERAYGASAILKLCQRAGVPMVFDAHHHVCHEGLTSYEHPSIAEFLLAARQTWPDPAWQLVHLSNGRDSFADPRHSGLIRAIPSAYRNAPWIEVEAKAKERAILRLRAEWPWLASP